MQFYRGSFESLFTSGQYLHEHYQHSCLQTDSGCSIGNLLWEASTVLIIYQHRQLHRGWLHRSKGVVYICDKTTAEHSTPLFVFTNSHPDANLYIEESAECNAASVQCWNRTGNRLHLIGLRSRCAQVKFTLFNKWREHLSNFIFPCIVWLSDNMPMNKSVLPGPMCDGSASLFLFLYFFRSYWQ